MIDKNIVDLLDNFFTRCAFVTICVMMILSSYYPRYEFLDATHRVDTITGKSEFYSNHSYDRGWRGE